MSKLVAKANIMTRAGSAKERDEKDLREMDAIFERMRANIPPQPYIMDTPSDRPYELAKSEIDNWRINTPFEAHERDLQYMTFIWRDPSKTLFSLRNIEEDPPIIPASTVVKSDLPKKKINFDAYKIRKLLQSSKGVSAEVKETAKMAGNTAEEKAQEAPQVDSTKVTETQSPTR